jgi:hypothetical protein
MKVMEELDIIKINKKMKKNPNAIIFGQILSPNQVLLE